MSRVIYKPLRSSQAATNMRYFIGWRQAAFYPEGTIVEDNDGARWVSTRDYEYDSWPWWQREEPIGRPRPDVSEVFAR